MKKKTKVIITIPKKISGIDLLEKSGSEIPSYKVVYYAESVFDFCKFHGIGKNVSKAFGRQFYMPGRRFLNLWSARKDQFEEFLYLVSKWGKDYIAPEDKSDRLNKKERFVELKKELELAREGRLHLSRPWDPLGG